MRVGLSDLAPHLAKRLLKWYRDAEQDTPMGRLRHNEDIARTFLTRLVAGSGIATGIVALIGASLLLVDSYPIAVPILSVLLGIVTATAVHFSYKGRMNRYFEKQLMEVGLPVVVATRAERLYVDTLRDIATLPEAEGGEMLAQMNELLALSDQLTRWQEETREMNADALREEVATLQQKARDAQDITARARFERSVTLAQERLEGVQHLHTLRERMEAQQEVICQTLAALQTALRRGKMAPRADALNEAERLTAAVREIHQQSRAMEQAVQEIAALRG
jgi:hypothetical protein